MKKIKINKWSEVPKNYTGIVEDSDGCKSWYLNSLLHRPDGPAVEYPSGTKEWFLNDEEFSEQNYWNHPVMIKHKLNKLLELSL